MKKRLLFLILCCVGMLSCNKSDIPDDLDKNPIFKFTKEKKYFDEFHTYSDVFKLYYYEHDVIQTNPNAIFPAEQISKLKDSLNYRLSKSEENKRDFFRSAPFFCRFFQRIVPETPTKTPKMTRCPPKSSKSGSGRQKKRRKTGPSPLLPPAP